MLRIPLCPKATNQKRRATSKIAIGTYVREKILWKERRPRKEKRRTLSKCAKKEKIKITNTTQGEEDFCHLESLPEERHITRVFIFSVQREPKVLFKLLPPRTNRQTRVTSLSGRRDERTLWEQLNLILMWSWTTIWISAFLLLFCWSHTSKDKGGINNKGKQASFPPLSLSFYQNSGWKRCASLSHAKNMCCLYSLRFQFERYSPIKFLEVKYFQGMHSDFQTTYPCTSTHSRSYCGCSSTKIVFPSRFFIRLFYSPPDNPILRTQFEASSLIVAVSGAESVFLREKER